MSTTQPPVAQHRSLKYQSQLSCYFFHSFPHIPVQHNSNSARCTPSSASFTNIHMHIGAICRLFLMTVCISVVTISANACPILVAPGNGTVSSTTGSTFDTVMYGCLPGYTLSGANRTSCLPTGLSPYNGRYFVHLGFLLCPQLFLP